MASSLLKTLVLMFVTLNACNAIRPYMDDIDYKYAPSAPNASNASDTMSILVPITNTTISSTIVLIGTNESNVSPDFKPITFTVKIYELIL
jgi:hypothetical protein